jgi:multiple sugar transport system permease protein
VLLLKQRSFFLTFFLPPFIVLMFFSLFAMFGVIGLSFFHVDLKHAMSGPGRIGLDNYIRLLSDARFWTAVKVSFQWCLGTTVASVAIGLLLALFLFRRFSRGVETFVSVLFVLPILLSRVGVAQIWKLLYRPFGLLNYLLSLVGVPIVKFLADTHLALFAVITVDVWQWCFLTAFLVLSLLNSIPSSYIEEAEVMGANRLQMHWNITLPVIFSGVLSIVFIKLVESLRTFDLLYNLTLGGPGTSTETLDLYAYYQGVTIAGNISYASAMSIFMLIITLVILTLLWNNIWKRVITS